MKELIDKLSLGVIKYEKPVMEVSVEEITIKMESEKIYRGNFEVISTNDENLKGIIFSTDNRLIIENDNFIGKNTIINYSVNTKYVGKGEEIKGKINIVSNGGEIAIPFNITVDAISAETTLGSIKNLFHFSNLVQMSYDEALKLFGSEKFSHIFLENDLPLMAVYNGLIGSKDINLAMEEFLVAAKKKSIVNISISKEIEEHNNIEENYGDSIIVSKDTWGYVGIELEIYGDFIKADKTRLTSNDFAGSNYELSYYIDKSKLHKGKNYGRIRFITRYQKLDFVVFVCMSEESQEEVKEYKKAVWKILKRYIDFRMKKINVDHWAEESDSIISKVRGIKDSMFMKLVQAQICVTKGRESDGAWLLENVAEDILPIREQEIELYCYYLYVRTIQKRDDEFTGEIIKKIKGYYENGYDSWKLLWILLYIDDMYDNNVSLKVLRIKEQYLKGMRSPLLYFEALKSFNEVPEMLRVLDEFEIQVLYFGMKNDFINKKLAMQINEVSKTERRLNPLVFELISKLYKKYDEIDILENICSLLIKSSKSGADYFAWFEQGIEKKLKITSLYEYYMYSISDDFDGVIPEIVMMYFTYNNTSLSYEKIDLLYANIVKNKESNFKIYNLYKIQFEKYVADNILKGRMNCHLAVIYEDVFSKSMVGPEIAEKLPDILNTYEIKCKNKNMSHAIIVHKEINKVDKYPIIKGKVYVRIYTEDAAIILEDVNGTRYFNDNDYTIRRLLDMEEYLKMCYEISTGNKGLILYLGDRYLKYRKKPDKSISILNYMLKMNELIEPFRLNVEKEIIDYYSLNYDGDNLDEYILNTSVEKLGAVSRVKLIELAIVRGLYDRAYELISQYGFYKIEPRRILKCVAKLIEKREFEEDKLLVEMSAFSFSKGKYNEEVLYYLGNFYNGMTKELLNVWKASNDFAYENKELEEKIIVQMLFTGAYVGKIEKIYDSYFQKGANSKVKKAYLFSKSYDYFVKESIIEESIFKYIEKDVYYGDEINDMCALAFLKHMSEKESMSKEHIEICQNLVFDLTKVNKVFEFYKSFKKYFRLPYSISDKTIVEYRTNPKNRVFIHYIIDDGNYDAEKYSVEEMTNICDGIFTYSFVLFYGENIQYYITEEYSEEVTVTESKTLSLSNVNFSSDNTHYGLLNDMLVCKDMNEEKTFEKMAKEYIIKRELLNTVLTVL